MNARQRLKTWLDTNGHRQGVIVELAETDKARVCRFLKGEGSAALPTLDAYRKIEALTGGAIKADELAVEAPPTGRRQPKVPRARHRAAARAVPASAMPAEGTAASPPAETIGAPPYDPALAGQLAGVAGCPESVALFEAMLRLALTAKAESTRQRAIADLLDRVNGRPTQKVLDLTPKPPAESVELVTLLESIIKPPPVASAPPALAMVPAEVPSA